jgi:hypothetical protein
MVVIVPSSITYVMDHDNDGRRYVNLEANALQPRQTPWRQTSKFREAQPIDKARQKKIVLFMGKFRAMFRYPQQAERPLRS